MYLIRTRNHNRRDFTGDFQCEHCGHEVTMTSCYDDGHYHRVVIPGYICENAECGKSTDSEPGLVPVQSGPRQDDSVVL